MFYEKTVLDSGIRVLTERMSGVRSVTLGVWIDTGSRDETSEMNGVTHFLEHLLFKGTETRNSKDIAVAFDSIGGEINAFTGREHTCVYFRVIDEYLPQAVEVAWDIILKPAIRKEDVESEARVVAEEISLHEDSPEELVHDLLASTMWRDNSLGLSVLGRAEVVRSLQPDNINTYHRDRYVADKIVVTAAGSVNHDNLCKVIEENTRIVINDTQWTRERSACSVKAGKTVKCKKTEQAHICLGSSGIPRQDPRRYAMTVMCNVLGGGMSSRLFQKVREELGLAYSVFSFHSMLIGCGMVGAYCGTHPSQAQKVVSLIEKEIKDLIQSGISGKELERSKNHIKGSLIIANEDSTSRMNRLAKAELADGEHLSVDELVERLDVVTIEDVQEVSRQTWGKGEIALAVVGPFEKDPFQVFLGEDFAEVN